MDYQIIWSPIALDSLDRACFRISRDRPLAASSFRQNVFDTVDQLKKLPRIGSLFEEDRTKTWRELFCEPYRIFYRVFDSNLMVQIALLWHASREGPSRADLLS